MAVFCQDLAGHPRNPELPHRKWSGRSVQSAGNRNATWNFTGDHLDHFVSPDASCNIRNRPAPRQRTLPQKAWKLDLGPSVKANSSCKNEKSCKSKRRRRLRIQLASSISKQWILCQVIASKRNPVVDFARIWKCSIRMQQDWICTKRKFGCVREVLRITENRKLRRSEP